MRPIPLLGVISLALFATKIVAATRLGFGDAEALYASYALFPAPVYVDHPGLIGSLARLVGGGSAPSPLAAHLVTALLSTATPWVGVLAARLAGAPLDRAALAGLALVCAPEIAVGLFAMTPDLLLAPLWLLAIGLAAFVARAKPDDPRATFASLGVGACVGLAGLAKAPALCLGLGLAFALFGSPARRTAGPWLATALAALLVSPVVLSELRGGFPMLAHRFVGTQAHAGFSLRNVIALPAGQLAYVGPLGALGALALLRDLAKRRHEPGARVPFAVTAATLVPLGLFCLWSRVAEPHWIAPALLALPVWLAVASPTLPGVVTRFALPSGLALAALVEIYALTDVAPRLGGTGYDGRFDLGNDLYEWKRTIPDIERAITRMADERGAVPVVVAPHWTIAAQLRAALPTTIVVASTGGDDDFARWAPLSTVSRAPLVLAITDDRFPDGPQTTMGDRVALERLTIPLVRGGRPAPVRTVQLVLLSKSDTAAR